MWVNPYFSPLKSIEWPLLGGIPFALGRPMIDTKPLAAAFLMLLFTLPTRAAPLDRAALPTALSCSSGSQVYVITHLNSLDQDPEFDGDGGFMEMEIHAASLMVSFSNECDNFYEFLFFRKNLEGTQAKIHGLLRDRGKTTAITCSLTR
jgi:hypothetical protein